MSHIPVIVTGSALWQQWDDEKQLPDEVAGLHIHPLRGYKITWPEHIHNPRFNSDCIITLIEE